jgi:hypothetical protein
VSGTKEHTRSINIKDRVMSAMRQTRTRLTRFGRDGFRGKDAEKALQELKEAQIMAQAEDEDEQRLLGSKRFYKFVHAATCTIQRPSNLRRATGISAILPFRKGRSKYPDGTRGARRPALREAQQALYRELSDEAKERYWHEQQQEALAHELRSLGLLPPVSLWFRG